MTKDLFSSLVKSLHKQSKARVINDRFSYFNFRQRLAQILRTTLPAVPGLILRCILATTQHQPAITLMGKFRTFQSNFLGDEEMIVNYITSRRNENFFLSCAHDFFQFKSSDVIDECFSSLPSYSQSIKQTQLETKKQRKARRKQKKLRS